MQRRRHLRQNSREHKRALPGVRTVDQSASFKIKCKQWKDVICGAVTCKPDADAFVQWYGDGCGTCGKTVGKVFKTDGTSVFDEEDETKLKENVADNIESFVNDYNYLMKRLAQSGDIVDSNYAKN